MKAFKKIMLVGAATLLAVSATACSSSSSSKDSSSKKPETAQKAKNLNSNKKWSYSNHTFKTSKLTYKITKTEVQPGLEDGKNNLVLYVDVTNNSKKEHEPVDVYAYVHATQKTSTSKVELDPGVGHVDDQGNNQLQTETDNMNNNLLPGKSVKGVILFELKNNTPVTVRYEDYLFNKVGQEVYNVK